MDVNDVTIYSRKTWGARYTEENYSVPKAEDVVIHHTVTVTLPEDASMDQEIAQMRIIESIGHNRFGYSVSYNVVVFPSGRAYQGCSFSKRGQHTGGMNSRVRSICLAGNYETDKPTDAQLQKVQNLVADGRGKWWRKDANVTGHRDHAQTACPGRNVYEHLQFFRNGKKPSKPEPVKRPKPERVTVNVSMPVIDLRNAEARPVKSRAVYLAQMLLVFAGYGLGRAGIDGIGGKNTRAALGRFQVDTGTGTGGKADYILGEKGWKELIGGWNA